VAQMPFGVREDHFQTRVHVFEPSLDFTLGELGFGQTGRLGGGGGFGRSRIHDFVGQALVLLRRRWVGARRFPGLAPANLA